MIRDLGARGSIEGQADDGFGPMVDEFVANFREHGDVGAALTVYAQGRPVVDLWGGLADRRTGRPWTTTTPAVMFSCTKGVMAVCAYLLVQDGRLDLDAPVAHYWPEFGQQGKEPDHRPLAAGPPGRPLSTRRSLSRDEVLAWDPVIAAIEAQAPLWHPGTATPTTPSPSAGSSVRSSGGSPVGLSEQFVRRRLGEPLGCASGSAFPPDERDGVAWMVRAPARHGPRGSPRERSSAGGPGRRTRPHDGRRVRLPRGRRPGDLQRPRHPGGRDPGRQRHQPTHARWRGCTRPASRPSMDLG